MHFESTLENLKIEFGLKPNHILILRALKNQDLSADEIVEKTKIPKGRIYSFLNELVDQKLVIKTKLKISTYGLSTFDRRLSDFLNLKAKELMEKKKHLINALEENDTIVDLINTSSKYIRLIEQFIANGTHFKMIYRANSVPFLFYTDAKEKFPEFFELMIHKKPLLITGQQRRILYNIYWNAYKAKKEFDIVCDKTTIWNYVKYCKDHLGVKKTVEILHAVVKSIKNHEINLRIIEQPFPYHLFISENTVISVLGHVQQIHGIYLDNEVIAQAYPPIFDLCCKNYEDFETYVIHVIGSLK